MRGSTASAKALDLIRAEPGLVEDSEESGEIKRPAGTLAECSRVSAQYPK